MLSLKAQLKGIDLDFDRSINLPQYLYGDAKKLRQILINLVANGIKFTERGYVKLEVNLENNLQSNSQKYDNTYWLRFTIKDTGVGIEPQEIDKLFTAFVQTKVGIKSEQGTGLGLAISQKFAKLMGGEITVKSQPKKGTTFTFVLPFRSGEPYESAADNIQRQVIALESGQPTYRILVVDDNLEGRTILTELLTPLGFEVREAQNGREAIEIWSNWLPHLIWMDLRMPVMDGYIAAKTIKNYPQGQKTRIIALTASIFEEDKAQVLECGCDDFVRKPFRVQELLEKISEYLGVRYIYDEVNPLTNISDGFHTSQPPKIIRQIALEHLENMPREWLLELHQAAEVVDNKYLRELIDEIPPTKSDLAEILLDLMESFRVDKIISLVEEISINK